MRREVRASDILAATPQQPVVEVESSVRCAAL